MHRTATLDGRAVAVKLQYPGTAETIAADLRNVALLRRMRWVTRQRVPHLAAAS